MTVSPLEEESLGTGHTGGGGEARGVGAFTTILQGGGGIHYILQGVGAFTTMCAMANKQKLMIWQWK